jgi:sec-independent protein translocase protein TatB
MFDVGFLELVVIMVLGLLVLGPERLPKAAQKVGYWFGKARRYVEGMKSQVEAEFDTSEVKRLLHNQEVQIRELQNKITESGDEINNEINHSLKNDFDDDDPGSSHDEAAAVYDGPQYDILEDDNGSWGEEGDSSVAEDNSAENKLNKTLEPAIQNEPADKSVSNKA